MSDKPPHPRILPPEPPNKIMEAVPVKPKKKTKYRGSLPNPKYYQGGYQSQKKKNRPNNWLDRGRLDPNRVSFVNPNFVPDAEADEVDYVNEGDEIEEAGEYVEEFDESMRGNYYTTRHHAGGSFHPQNYSSYSEYEQNRGRDSRRHDVNYDYMAFKHGQSSSSSGHMQPSSSAQQEFSASPNFDDSREEIHEMEQDERCSETPPERPVTGFSCALHDNCCTPPPEVPKYDGNPTYESYCKIGLGFVGPNHETRRPFTEYGKYLEKHPKKHSPDFDSFDLIDKYWPNWRTEKRKPRSRSRSRSQSPPDWYKAQNN